MTQQIFIPMQQNQHETIQKWINIKTIERPYSHAGFHSVWHLHKLWGHHNHKSNLQAMPARRSNGSFLLHKWLYIANCRYIWDGGVLLMLKDRLKIWHSYDNRNVSLSINILCSFFCFRFNEIPKIKCINPFHHCSVLTHQVCSVGRQLPAPVPPDTHRCI